MKHVRDSIQAYVSGELDRERTAAVETHLADCDECRREAEQGRALWEMLGSVETEQPGGGSIWPAVRARTLEKNDAIRDWFFGGGLWARTGLATAAVAAGLLVGILVPMGGSPDAVAAGDDSTAWLVESSWISGSSWLAGEGSRGLDDILLGADAGEKENGS